MLRGGVRPGHTRPCRELALSAFRCPVQAKPKGAETLEREYSLGERSASTVELSTQFPIRVREGNVDISFFGSRSLRGRDERGCTEAFGSPGKLPYGDSGGADFRDSEFAAQNFGVSSLVGRMLAEFASSMLGKRGTAGLFLLANGFAGPFTVSTCSGP